MIAVRGSIMCGRYALYGPKSRLREFGVDCDDSDPFEKVPHDLWNPFNIAPTQSPPVVCSRRHGRGVILARWGLLPRWVKDPSAAMHPINAKLETAADRPMFKEALRKRRVLVPASGFYEWQPVPGSRQKQPYFIRPVGGESLFGFGGLLERWQGPEGDIVTFAILTTAANELIQPIHERMPVIVRSEDYDAWLDPGVTDPVIVREIACAYPVEQMEVYRVGRAVGSSQAEGPQLVQPSNV